MRIIGIIAEYNPFHLGHLYHIKQSRAIAGEDAAIVCVMSGNFAQRGEPAVFGKFARAEAALRCGADLVFELPLPWALSSAEGFARGAVGLLGSLGAVDTLSFGSEEGSVAPLESVAEALLDPTLGARIKAELAATTGTYAAARQTVLRETLGDRAAILETPNNILAVEYLKAIYEQRLSITPITVPRSGAGHDSISAGDGFRSASEIRALLRSDRDAYAFMPRAAAEIFRSEEHLGRGPVSVSDLETALLSRLRMLPEEAFDALPDEGEGLGKRLCRACQSEPTLDAVYAAAKTKRFTLSRIRRMTMCACLGIRSGMARETPPYARLLGASAAGREVLRIAGEKASIPIIIKPASIKTLSPDSRRLFELECAADDLYVLGFRSREERRGGSTWRKSPVIL